MKECFNKFFNKLMDNFIIRAIAAGVTKVTQSVTVGTISKNSVFTTFATVINLTGVINASLVAVYAWGTAPTAGKTLDFYALYSEDGTNFDTAAITTATLLASYTLDADTNSQQVTILDIPVSAKYMKIAVYTNEVTYDGTMSSLKFIGEVGR